MGSGLGTRVRSFVLWGVGRMGGMDRMRVGLSGGRVMVELNGVDISDLVAGHVTYNSGNVDLNFCEGRVIGGWTLRRSVLAAQMVGEGHGIIVRLLENMTDDEYVEIMNRTAADVERYRALTLEAAT